MNTSKLRGSINAKSNRPWIVHKPLVWHFVLWSSISSFFFKMTTWDPPRASGNQGGQAPLLHPSWTPANTLDAQESPHWKPGSPLWNTTLAPVASAGAPHNCNCAAWKTWNLSDLCCWCTSYLGLLCCFGSSFCFWMCSAPSLRDASGWTRDVANCARSHLKEESSVKGDPNRSSAKPRPQRSSTWKVQTNAENCMASILEYLKAIYVLLLVSIIPWKIHAR